jgi:hypothetical protein
MGQQLPNGDPVSARPLHREVRQVTVQRAVEAHLAFRRELHHGGRGERLGDRGKVENGLAVDGGRPGSILIAHAESKNDLAAPPDPGGKTGHSMLVREVPDDRLKWLRCTGPREDWLTGARTSCNEQQHSDCRPSRDPASGGGVRPNAHFD